MQITATQAKSHLGYFCAKANGEPVFIEKDGQLDSVILSFDTFQTLKAGQAPVSIEQRKRAFQEHHKNWLAAQSALQAAYGLWCNGSAA